MSAFRLMAGSLWSPGAAFREILEARARPWVPMAIHILFGVMLVAAIISRVDLGELLLAQAAQQGSTMPAEQRETAAEFLNSPVLMLLVAAAPVLFVPLMFFVVAGVYFGMFLIFGSTARYGQYLSLLTYAYTPQILNSCVLMALVFVSRPTSLDPSMLGGVSPAILITVEAGTTTPGPLFAAASSLNLFTLWVLALLVIAFRGLVSRRTSTAAVAVGVVIPWVVYVAYRVGMAAVFG